MVAQRTAASGGSTASTPRWRSEEILDLGDISTSRGTEMYLPLWIRIYGANQNGAFNIAIVPATQ